MGWNSRTSSPRSAATGDSASFSSTWTRAAPLSTSVRRRCRWCGRCWRQVRGLDLVGAGAAAAAGDHADARVADRRRIQAGIGDGVEHADVREGRGIAHEAALLAIDARIQVDVGRDPEGLQGLEGVTIASPQTNMVFVDLAPPPGPRLADGEPVSPMEVRLTPRSPRSDYARGNGIASPAGLASAHDQHDLGRLLRQTVDLAPRGDGRLPRVLRQDELTTLLDDPPARTREDAPAIRARDDAVLELHGELDDTGDAVGATSQSGAPVAGSSFVNVRPSLANASAPPI